MHLGTYTAASAGKMISHYERSIGEREHIDRDGVVYNLAPAFEKGPRGRYRELVKGLEIGSKTRPLADILVTKPKSYVGDMRSFFEAAYAELVERVGEDTVVCAYVHLDEPGAEPHMHFAFVPVADVAAMTNDKTKPLLWSKKDEEKNPEHKAGTQKLDSNGTPRWKRVPVLDEAGNPVLIHTAKASAIFSQKDMKEFHPQMEEALCKRLGLNRVGITLDEDDSKKKLSELEHDEYERVTTEMVRSEVELAEKRAEVAAEIERLERLRRAEAQAREDIAKIDRRINETRSRIEQLRERIAAAAGKTMERLRMLIGRGDAAFKVMCSPVESYATPGRSIAAPVKRKEHKKPTVSGDKSRFAGYGSAGTSRGGRSWKR